MTRFLQVLLQSHLDRSLHRDHQCSFVDHTGRRQQRN